MTYQTKLRTIELTPNKNISFPIGTILAVQDYYNFLRLHETLGKHKSKGRNINSLTQALLSYKLTENLSITKASDWINRDEVLDIFNLEPFEQRTLYRLLETIGENWEEIIADIQDTLFNLYDFEHTDINLDWTSFILWGIKCSIAKYGYSRDHRPDKKQINVGLSELSDPINIPIGMTIKEGNVPDQVHFLDTFDQVKDKLKKKSLAVFDQGANRKENLDHIVNSKMKYLTIRQLNKSDDKNRINGFDKKKAELIDKEKQVYGVKNKWPSKYNYFYFSEGLKKNQIESKLRKVIRQYEEAEVIQKSIEENKGIPKRFTINNPLIDCVYSYQTKLASMNEKEAKELLKKAAITGREGFFCLVSNKNLTLFEALLIYRQKDSIEKIIHSLKNEIEIKPLRVWSDNSIYGALLIGFITQLILSLTRFENEDLKHTSPKSIKNSLKNLTVTVEYRKNAGKRYIFSNFNPISNLILSQNHGFT